MYAVLRNKVTSKELVLSLATVTIAEFEGYLKNYDLVEYTNYLVVR